MELAPEIVQEANMKKRLLSIPQLMFVVVTRAALGAGVGLLAGSRLTNRKRRAAGLTLALVGAATTIPAVRMVAGAKPSLMARLGHRFA
jgi:Tfp pilus assembly protein PilN